MQVKESYGNLDMSLVGFHPEIWSVQSTPANRHFSVTPYITICPSTETYFGLYLRGAMSAVTGIYLFRLLLNIIFFFCPEIFLYLNKQCIP